MERVADPPGSIMFVWTVRPPTSTANECWAVPALLTAMSTPTPVGTEICAGVIENSFSDTLTEAFPLPAPPLDAQAVAARASTRAAPNRPRRRMIRTPKRFIAQLLPGFAARGRETDRHPNLAGK